MTNAKHKSKAGKTGNPEKPKAANADGAVDVEARRNGDDEPEAIGPNGGDAEAGDDNELTGFMKNLSNVLLRAIPGLGTIGTSILAQSVPWFGWLAYIGFVDNLNTTAITTVIGGLTNDQYKALASEAVRQSILGLLRSPKAFFGALVLLFLATVYVSIKPSSPPKSRARTSRGGAFYSRHYYSIMTGVFLLLFAYLILTKHQSHVVAVLLTFLFAIPLFSFRHGYDAKNNPQTVAYVSLLLILVLSMIAYPYRFGRSAYRHAFIWSVPESTEGLSRLQMEIQPPAAAFNLALSCQRENWLIELGVLDKVKGVSKRVYGSLTELGWECKNGQITPVEYTVPKQGGQ